MKSRAEVVNYIISCRIIGALFDVNENVNDVFGIFTIFRLYCVILWIYSRSNYGTNVSLFIFDRFIHFHSIINLVNLLYFTQLNCKNTYLLLSITKVIQCDCNRYSMPPQKLTFRVKTACSPNF